MLAFFKNHFSYRANSLRKRVNKKIVLIIIKKKELNDGVPGQQINATHVFIYRVVLVVAVVVETYIE